MDTKEIREAIRRDPFRPFVLCLNDGREIPVKRLGAIVVGLRQVAVVDVDELFTHLSPEQITSLRFLDPPPDAKKASSVAAPAQAGSNGSIDTEEIREAVVKRPFRPFALRLNDGREICVTLVGTTLVCPRDIWVVDVDEVFTRLKPDQITSLRFLDQ
jgi:hypothetical protein